MEDYEVYIPLLGADFKELHPAISFNDEAMIGVWLRSKSLKFGRVLKKLWFFTKNGLLSEEEVINSGYLSTIKPVIFEKRISDNLLKCKDLVEFVEYVDTNNVYNNILKKAYYTIYNSTNSTNSTNSPKTNNSNNTIKNENLVISTIDGEFPKKILKITFTAIFNKFNYYIDTTEDNKIFLAIYSLGTYFFPLFSSYPYIYLGGTKQSGKTTILNCMQMSAFNSISAGNLTSSTTFRMVDATKPTLLIDEVDNLAQSKNAPELRQLLLSGYKKGMHVYRSMQTGRKVDFVVKKFDIYCPKILANIRGLDDVLEDRAIPLILRRTRNKEYGDRSSELMTDRDWQDIRDLSYISLLFSWKLIKNIYETMNNETDIRSREWELWKPILAIALAVDDKIYERMVKMGERKAKEKITENVTEQNDTLLAKTLCEIVTHDNYYGISLITEKFKEQFEDDQHWMNSKWVGKSLRRLGFNDKRTVNGRRQIYLRQEEVIDVALRLGVDVGEIEHEEKQETLNVINLEDKIKKLKADGIDEVKYEEMLQYLTNDEIEKAISVGLLLETRPGIIKVL